MNKVDFKRFISYGIYVFDGNQILRGDYNVFYIEIKIE